MISYKERLNAINTFIFDVDGVFTDGKISIFQGDFIRSIDSKDLFALQYALKNEYKIFIITGAHSIELEEFFTRVGVTGVHIKSSNKLAVYSKFKEQHGFSDENVLFMGDDLPDYPVMKVVGCATCPQDAVHEIKEIAHYQSPKNGGNQAVRDVIEQVLRVQGKWFLENAVIW